MRSITVKFFAKPDIAVPVYLMSVPPLTDEKASTPTYGRWVCKEPYLGRRSEGIYYVKRLPETACTKEQQWKGVCDLSRNPYAFFFDTSVEKQANDGRPFMLWDHFYMDLGADSSGKGKLLVPEFSPGSGLKFEWSQDQ